MEKESKFLNELQDLLNKKERINMKEDTNYKILVECNDNKEIVDLEGSGKALAYGLSKIMYILRKQGNYPKEYFMAMAEVAFDDKEADKLFKD